MKQFLMLIGGPMGAGKTSVAKIVHERLPGVALLGKDKIKWFVSHFSRTPEERKVAMAVTMAMVREYLKNGVGVILDESYLFPEDLEKFYASAKEFGVAPLAYIIDAPLNIRVKRIKERPAPAVARTPVSDGRIERNTKLYAENRFPNPTKIFDSTNSTPEQIADEISVDLKNLT